MSSLTMVRFEHLLIKDGDKLVNPALRFTSDDGQVNAFTEISPRGKLTLAVECDGEVVRRTLETGTQSFCHCSINGGEGYCQHVLKADAYLPELTDKIYGELLRIRAEERPEDFIPQASSSQTRRHRSTKAGRRAGVETLRKGTIDSKQKRKAFEAMKAELAVSTGSS